jgi:hypothetical protein
MVVVSAKPDHVAGSIMVSVLRAYSAERLHDNISLRDFLATIGPEKGLDQAAAFYEEKLCMWRGIEIHCPNGDSYALFIKGLTCPCCGHTN